jgi:hypothetical protein
VCALAERGLAFRGSNEEFGSPNNGHFLCLIELIAKFDRFLAKHKQNYGNTSSGHKKRETSCLSKRICNELIQLVAKKVTESILNDLRGAGYFSLSVDSTADLSHVDQLTVTFRYVTR